jgi:hypothetical protein
MPKVDIVNDTGNGYGTVIKLDGVELRDVTDYSAQGRG